MDGVAETLVSSLRKLAPIRVRVVDSHDESRDVAVPHGRKRWSQVAATIEAMPWVRCELLDKAGAVLGYVQNDGAADGLEDISAPVSSASVQARWMLELMLRAQQVALTYRDKEHVAVLASMREMMEVSTGAIREMREIWREQREAAVEVAQLRAAAEAGDGMEQFVKLIEASPKMMQTLGPLLMAFKGPRRLAEAKPAPPPPPAPPPAPPPPPQGKAKRK